MLCRHSGAARIAELRDAISVRISVYSEETNIGSGSIYLKPTKRVTAAVGYTVTSSNGSTLILNPIAPTGPLSFNYHLPRDRL